MAAPSVLLSFFATTCHVAPVARSAHSRLSSSGVQLRGINTQYADQILQLCSLLDNYRARHLATVHSCRTKAHLEKLRRDAAECETIAQRATDEAKRAIHETYPALQRARRRG
jgi:predicted ATPase